MKPRTEMSMKLYEMLAILSDRNAIMRKKEAEQAQAKVNELYMYGLDIEWLFIEQLFIRWLVGIVWPVNNL